jgi:Co/Zn/Cd efflux system component
MSDHCCDSTIETETLHGRQRRVLATVLAINVAAFLMMVVGAFLSGSSSLLSGTLDNLGDALTYALSFAVVGASMAAKARVALFKGVLILAAAVAVAAQIIWRLQNPAVPVVDTMGVAAVLNLGANAVCLALLHPFRDSDINMASVWECSRNDVFEGFAVIVAAATVWALNAGWPDIAVACALLLLFLRSTTRVLSAAVRQVRTPAVD